MNNKSQLTIRIFVSKYTHDSISLATHHFIYSSYLLHYPES